MYKNVTLIALMVGTKIKTTGLPRRDSKEKWEEKTKLQRYTFPMVISVKNEPGFYLGSVIQLPLPMTMTSVTSKHYLMTILVQNSADNFVSPHGLIHSPSYLCVRMCVYVCVYVNR